MKHNSQNKAETPAAFFGRLDIYWQSLAVYAVALVAYSLVKGTVAAGAFSIAIYDPIVMLLLAFVVIAALALFFRWFLRPTIIISNEAVVIRNRMRERILLIKNMTRIAFGRGGRGRMSRYRIIKIKVSGRRRTIRIRPSLYVNDKELMTAIADIKRRVRK